MYRLFLTLSSLVLLISPWNLAGAAVVIQYHHVSDDTPAVTSVSPDQFSEHMAYLSDNGFQVWALPRLVRALRSGKPTPDRVIAITFDDGYESVYTHAWPILRKHDFPFTVFINTRLVGGQDFMNWDQLRRLAINGKASIANHTASHPHLVRLKEGESRDAWQRRVHNEMGEAETAIVARVKQSPGLLAYPYGEYNTRIKVIAADLSLVAFAQNSGAFDGNVDWQAVPRFPFGGAYAEMEGFANKVNSRPMPLQSAFASIAGERLEDPLLPAKEARPTLTLKLESAGLASRVHCFASGQGRIDVQVNGSTVTTVPSKALPIGRSHINCTAPSDQEGRFYWYSHFFMRKNEDGSWYQEY